MASKQLKVDRNTRESSDTPKHCDFLSKWAAEQALVNENSVRVARELAQYLNLGQMPPSFLAEVVGASGLAADAPINVAWKQALLLEDRAETSLFKKARADAPHEAFSLEGK
jgi:hypothetical protein